MFHNKKLLLLIAGLLFISLTSTAQVCNQMFDKLMEITRKNDSITTISVLLDKEKTINLIKLCHEEQDIFNNMAVGVTDENTLNTYRYCMLAAQTNLNSELLKAGKENSHAIYELLNPIKDMVYKLDDFFLKGPGNIVCTSNIGRWDIRYPEYQEYAVRFHDIYLSVCTLLGKTTEADSIFNHIRNYSYGYGNKANYEYSIAAKLIRSKLKLRSENSLADPIIFSALQYMTTCYIKDHGYNANMLPMSLVVSLLNLPVMADKKVPNRAEDFYKIYQNIAFYAKLDTNFKSPVKRQIFKQALNSATETTEIPTMMAALTFKGLDEVTSDVVLNDPAILQLVIKIAEHHIEKKGKYREPYFWQNLAQLYTAAGKTNEAATAEKMYRRYKY